MAPKPSKRSRSKIGRRSRAKGKEYERELAEAFRAVFPNARRTLSQSRDSGEAPDIEVPGYWVEGKHHTRVSIRRAYEQAIDELERFYAGVGSDGHPRVPIAVTKDNGKESLVTLSLVHFLDMLLELKTARDNRSVQLRSASLVEVPVFRMAQPGVKQG
jgi:hypothetical protein